MKPLSQFSDEHLYARLQGLAKNFYYSDGKLFLPGYVAEAFHETKEEALKRGPLPKLDVKELIHPADPTPTFHEKFVVRYAKYDRLEELRAGIVSFGPAKHYADLPNAAQQDDELQRDAHLPDAKAITAGTSYPATNLMVSRKIRHRGGDFIHYNFLSMSFEESPKLQRAFEAEGYVMIHDFEVFYATIKAALHTKLGCGRLAYDHIRYYDDRVPPDLKSDHDLAFTKTIAFQYQREIRISVFEVPNPDERFEIKVKWPTNLISEVKKF